VEIGLIGLGNMGFPMARRLIQGHHRVVAFDMRSEALDRLVALGAHGATSPKEVADLTETVLVSLPTPQVSLEVATGAGGVIEGSRVKRYVDLSTVGSRMAVRIHDLLAQRNIVRIDAPVSGGVGGAEKGALAVMVSGPRSEFDLMRTVLEQIGRPFYVGEKPGSAQTMKLVNNILAANVLAATAEAVVMGVKAGLDPNVMIEVLNAGSGATSASRDKFPRAILPRTFDYGFATGLMVKDVRLYLDEAKTLDVPVEVAGAVGRLWETAEREEGPASDFTAVIKPLEKSAGVTVGRQRSASV
jgi:3-hydroxyisobutyrate dehydrogenase-like beta-hydroxyacid dehydrogenase